MKDRLLQLYILLIMYLFCSAFYLAMQRRTPKPEGNKIIWVNKVEMERAKKDSLQRLSNDLWRKLKSKYEK